MERCRSRPAKARGANGPRPWTGSIRNAPVRTRAGRAPRAARVARAEAHANERAGWRHTACLDRERADLRPDFAVTSYEYRLVTHARARGFEPIACHLLPTDRGASPAVPPCITGEAMPAIRCGIRHPAPRHDIIGAERTPPRLPILICFSGSTAITWCAACI